MGGKSKQSQRTKNNARPASSARSAELLSSPVRLESSIFTTGGKALPSLFPTLVTPVGLDQELSPEYTLCLKKLSKKDPVTKTKALQELCELINNNKAEGNATILPSWAHLYRGLSADTDHKVRENAQLCHGVLVASCGKRIAPQLKQIVPAWIHAQYDEYGPAASAATNSLHSTFPEKKLPEVITFCKAEVMAHLMDNLIGNAEATLAKKIENPEERELQYTRIVSSSLRELEYLVEQLAPSHDDWLWTELSTLLQSNQLWKLASHTAPNVRASWFAVMGRVISRFKQSFGEKYGQKTIRLLLGTTSKSVDGGGNVTAQLWACLLLIMHHVEDWHKWLDKKELLVKRLLDVLESGGWGDARHLSNMLLPILAHLPEDIVTKQFYEMFFASMFVGLQKKSVLNSKSERQFWITSLAECLRYMSLQQQDFVIEVATSVHRNWLQIVLSPKLEGQMRSNLIRHSASSMTSLVKYWLKQSKEKKEEKYDQLVRNFWQNIGATVLTQVDQLSMDQDEIAKLVDGHILFLQTLKTSLSQEAKKQQNITFEDNTQVNVEHIAESVQDSDPIVIERYNHNLNELVQNICSNYFDFASKKEVSNAVMVPLLTLLKEFDSEKLFVAISRHFGGNTVYNLYDNVLRVWLSGDTMRCKAVVDVIFILLKHLKEEDQDILFDSFKQFPPSVVEWCISLSLSHPHCSLPAARRWMKGRLVEDSVLSVCKRVIEDGDGRAKNLLLMCLSHTREGEVIISDSAISRILSTFTTALQNCDVTALEQVTGVASQLASELTGAARREEWREQYYKLLQALFHVNVKVQRGDATLSVDTWCEVRSVWQDALCTLPDREMFVADASDQIVTRFLISQETLDIPNIEHLTSLCPHLLSHFNENEPPDDLSEIIRFSKKLFEFRNYTNGTSIESFAIRHYCVESNLNCPFSDDNSDIKIVVEQSSKADVEELSKKDLVVYVNKMLFRALFLRTMLLHNVSCDNEEGMPVDGVSWCNEFLKEDYFAQEFANVLHDCALIDALNEGYAFWPHYEIIVQSKRRIEAIINDIISDSSQESRQKISEYLSQKAVGDGYFWSYARKSYEIKVLGEDEAVKPEQFDMEKLQEVLSGNGFFHSFEANCKFSKDKDATYRLRYLLMLRCFYLSYAQDESFSQDALSCVAGNNLDVVVNAYYRDNDTMLYERTLQDADWQQVISNASVADFLCELVEQKGWDLPSHHLDFTTIALCSLLTSVEKSKDHWGSTKVAIITRSTLALYSRVHTFVANIKSKSLRRQPSEHVAHLIEEWADIFAPDLQTNLFNIVVNVLNSGKSIPMSSNHAAIIEALLHTTSQMEWHLVPKHHRLGDLTLEKIVGACTDVLREPTHHGYKLLAYNVLKAISKELVLDDAEKLKVWSEANSGEEEPQSEKPHFSPSLFEDTLYHLQEMVDAALINVKVGEDTCEMVPFSDSCSIALGYLLLSHALCDVCSLGTGDLMHHYIEVFREHKYVDFLLPACLRLLPAEVARFAHNTSNVSPPAAYQESFLTTAHFTIKENMLPTLVGQLSCRVLFLLLSDAGASEVRGWYGVASQKAGRMLRQITKAYVTSVLCKKHLTGLQNKKMKDTEVRIVWSSMEATVVHKVEDHSLELVIIFGAEHPLSIPRVSPAASHAPNTHWIPVYLAYQNGTLSNAVLMWIRTIAARMEAAPQCYICYCRLHVSNARLPRIPCAQCHNKYHPECLGKWFETNPNRTCPLCRAKMA